VYAEASPVDDDVRPSVTNELFLCYDLAGTFDQTIEQIERPAAERQHFAIAPQFSLTAREFERTESQRVKAVSRHAVQPDTENIAASLCPLLIRLRPVLAPDAAAKRVVNRLARIEIRGIDAWRFRNTIQRIERRPARAANDSSPSQLAPELRAVHRTARAALDRSVRPLLLRCFGWLGLAAWRTTSSTRFAHLPLALPGSKTSGLRQSLAKLNPFSYKKIGKDDFGVKQFISDAKLFAELLNHKAMPRKVEGSATAPGETRALKIERNGMCSHDSE
jgi:hypothetical protein